MMTGWRKQQKTNKGTGQNLPDDEDTRTVPADRRDKGLHGASAWRAVFIPAVHAGGNRSGSQTARAKNRTQVKRREESRNGSTGYYSHRHCGTGHG